LAQALERLGQYWESYSLARRALEINSQIFGLEHPNTLPSMGTLAYMAEKVGRYEEAERHHRRVLSASIRVLGNDAFDTWNTANNLGRFLTRHSDYVNAEPILRGNVSRWEIYSCSLDGMRKPRGYSRRRGQ
jgi:hypothetical protein